ncbi:MAG: helix-turn-helix transcriptional regulator [Candidatus Eremiobacteraeota bacterium]|nr:helix-turn-helix transcriptional regulator [Candidatus Eremiobacteraeota bacterium]
MVDSIVQFGERLREAREFAGLSQDQVAEKLEVDPETVSRWERQVRFPRRARLDKLANLLGKPVDWFFQARVGPEPPPPTPREALRVLQASVARAESLELQLARAKAEIRRLQKQLSALSHPPE